MHRSRWQLLELSMSYQCRADHRVECHEVAKTQHTASTTGHRLLGVILCDIIQQPKAAIIYHTQTYCNSLVWAFFFISVILNALTVRLYTITVIAVVAAVVVVIAIIIIMSLA